MKELLAGLPEPEVRGVFAVRDSQGRIKLDEGFDITRLSPELQQEIQNGNVIYSRP
jgi:hypothetical protein